MNVVIDISGLKSNHQFRGIGNYLENLITAIKKTDQQNNYILSDHPGKEPKKDLIHYPFFSPFFLSLPLIKKTKIVVTVHDLIPLIFPKQYPPGIKGKIKFEIQKILINQAEAIITDSQNSSSDIVHFLKVDPKKVNVIYLASPPEFYRKELSLKIIEQFKKKYNLPREFVLYVGDVNFNKNILGLATACKKINVPLVIVGRQAAQTKFAFYHPENQSLVKLLKQYGSDPTIIRLGYLSVNDLVTIYHLATVYCQPSFYEGFGLPVLEAMACGCPVVAANTSSLMEICGDAAVMVNPYQLDELANGIKLVLNNPKQKRKLQERGLKQTKKFSWIKTAKETIKVYQQVNEN